MSSWRLKWGLMFGRIDTYMRSVSDGICSSCSGKFVTRARCADLSSLKKFIGVVVPVYRVEKILKVSGVRELAGRGGVWFERSWRWVSRFSQGIFDVEEVVF